MDLQAEIIGMGVARELHGCIQLAPRDTLCRLMDCMLRITITLWQWIASVWSRALGYASLAMIAPSTGTQALAFGSLNRSCPGIASRCWDFLTDDYHPWGATYRSPMNATCEWISRINIHSNFSPLQVHPSPLTFRRLDKDVTRTNFRVTIILQSIQGDIEPSNWLAFFAINGAWTDYEMECMITITTRSNRSCFKVWLQRFS